VTQSRFVKTEHHTLKKPFVSARAFSLKTYDSTLTIILVNIKIHRT